MKPIFVRIFVLTKTNKYFNYEHKQHKQQNKKKLGYIRKYCYYIDGHHRNRWRHPDINKLIRTCEHLTK